VTPEVKAKIWKVHMYYGNNIFGANGSEEVHDWFRKTELTNNRSCQNYTAFSIESSTDRSVDLKKLAHQLGCITTAGEDRKLTLKRLCTTRWSSRIDIIRVTKNRLGDIIQLMKGYIKDSKNKKKQEAQNLLKPISIMEFVILLSTCMGKNPFFNKFSIQRFSCSGHGSRN
jgi:hypothetical protein